MSDLRTAAQQMLEACRMCVPMDGRHAEVDAAFRNLRAALAQQDEPVEPVAWVLALPDGRLDRLSVVAYDDEAEEMLQRSIAGCTLVPLYTAPPQRLPLTEEEIDGLVIQHAGYGRDNFYAVVRAVERAHGIKE